MAPRQKKDSPEESSEKTTVKKTGKRGRPKGSKNKKTSKKTAKKTSSKKKTATKKIAEEVVVEKQEEEEELEKTQEAPKRNSLLVEKPTQWILTKQMQFGIINEGFSVGSIFTVDWETRCMRCEDNGVIYENIKDLEIAIKIGTVEPYMADGSESQYEQQRYIESEAKANKNRQMMNDRQSRDEQVRDMISRSDQDVVENIDISNTRNINKKRVSKPIHVTPTSEVTIQKPQRPNQMEVHYSDSPQDGQIVRSSNQPTVRDRVSQTRTGSKPLSPVLASKHNWDVTKGEGKIQSEINQKMGDYSIKVDENGQQFIRGLPVIRDDSEASGPSLNAGRVVSLTKQQLAERANRIAQIKQEKQAEVAQNRSKAGIQTNESVVNNPASQIQNIMPQEVTAGVGISDSGITPAEHEIKPIGEKTKKSSTAGKLLRRR